MKAKIHTQGTDRVLACADETLIGSTLEEGDIHFHVSEKFYGGKKVDPKELEELLADHENINLVGEETVSVAIGQKIVDAKDVRRIQGVPHVQIFQF